MHGTPPPLPPIPIVDPSPLQAVFLQAFLFGVHSLETQNGHFSTPSTSHWQLKSEIALWRQQ